MTRALLGAFLVFGCARVADGAELLFAFFPVPNNAAQSTRSFSAEEVLVVTVTGMRPGDLLELGRCGNARCSVGAAVATWTFEDFERGPTEVATEGDRYEFLAFTDGRRVGLVGARASLENGVTTLRFTSGMSVAVEVRAAK